MSSSDRHTRRALLLALGLAPTLMLGGCFRPMYATPSDGSPALNERLATIAVDEATERVGQQVRNALTFGLTGGGAPAAPQYALHMTVTSSAASGIVDSHANTPEIDTVVVVCSYGLTRIGSPAVLLSGTAYGRKSYDRGLQRFAALRAQRDAENDSAKLVAEQLKTRLAIFLADHP